MANENQNLEVKSLEKIDKGKIFERLGMAMPPRFSPKIPFGLPIVPTPLLVPGAPGVNPFKDLPFPSPGERIKADDFKKLSQGLQIISDMYTLSSAVFGRNFGEVKLVLTSQQYQIHKVMSVFGTEMENLNDASLDNRKVIQIAPVTLGERRIIVILTEAVETRRFAPNLLGLTYKEASERLRALLGDVTFPSTPMNVSQLIGLSLKEAKETFTK